MSSKPPLFYFHFFLLAILEVWQVYIISFHLQHQHFLCAILILILILIFFYVSFVEFSKLLKWLQSVGGNVSSGHLSHYSNQPVCYFFFNSQLFGYHFFSQLQEFGNFVLFFNSQCG